MLKTDLQRMVTDLAERYPGSFGYVCLDNFNELKEFVKAFGEEFDKVQAQLTFTNGTKVLIRCGKDQSCFNLNLSWFIVTHFDILNKLLCRLRREGSPRIGMIYLNG